MTSLPTSVLSLVCLFRWIRLPMGSEEVRYSGSLLSRSGKGVTGKGTVPTRRRMILVRLTKPVGGSSGGRFFEDQIGVSVFPFEPESGRTVEEEKTQKIRHPRPDGGVWSSQHLFVLVIRLRTSSVSSRLFVLFATSFGPLLPQRRNE